MRLFSVKTVLTICGLILGLSAAMPGEAASEKGLPDGRMKLVSIAYDRQTLGAPGASVVRPGPGDIEFTNAWLDTLPEASGGPQWECLSEALYFEARGETVKGQFAVAEVILNRVKSERFPSAPCDVINQGTGKKYQCQFTYTCDGHKEIIAEPRAYERVSKVARLALDGVAPRLTKGATHYHTTAVKPKWSRVYERTAAIGTHVFYRHTWQTASN
jgi:spore germination cell wall hydrolase CwlJ-like protein